MECVDGYFDFSDTMGNYMGFKLKEEEKGNGTYDCTGVH